MSIILNRLNKDVTVDGENQKFIFDEINGRLVLQQTKSSTSEISPSVGVELLDNLGRGLILENESKSDGNVARLKLVNESGVEMNVLTAKNGVLELHGVVFYESVETEDLVVNKTTILKELYVEEDAMILKNLEVGESVTILTPPTISNHAATKEYVDNSSGSNNYLFARVSATYSSNVAAGQYVKFNQVFLERKIKTPFISLDTTSAYTIAANTAGLGRITLRANKTYKITTNIIMNAVAYNDIGLHWVRVSGITYGTFVAINQLTFSLSCGRGDNVMNCHSGNNVGLYKVGSVDEIIALRFTFIGNTSNVQVLADSAGLTGVLVEQLD